MAEQEIFVIGTSQSVASAAMREQIYVDLEELYETLGELLTARGLFDEAVPLATCGRLELYCVASDPERAVKVLVRMMERRTGVGRDALRDHVYALRGDKAVRHLFRVASGLDSVVHGEAQILGQVREAARDRRAVMTKGPILHRLFEMALATGKKVRTETEIGRGAASLAGAALGMVQREMTSLASSTALVIGAGDTGVLVARLLAKAGIGKLIVANRTLSTAESAAGPLGADVIGLDQLADGIARADLVVGAVTADDFVVTVETMSRLNGTGNDRSRYFLDLAHPRNFEPALAEFPGVELFDLDHVFERVEAAKASRAAQVPRAEAIVVAQAEHFRGWLRSRQGVDVLRAVRAHVLDVAQEEAERFARGRTDEEREQIRRFARSMARTLLHQPTVVLRDADPGSPSGRSILEAAPALFGVDVDEHRRGELDVSPSDSPGQRARGNGDQPGTKVGVLTINFGEPDEPTMEKVVPFLERIFLQNSNLEPNESGRERARQLAEARAPGLIEEYEKIGGSPLNRQADEQAARLATALQDRGWDAHVYSAFQFTEPTIAESVARARSEGVDTLVAVPVYPICGQSTTVAALEAVRDALDGLDWHPPFRGVSGWHHDEAYRALRTENVRAFVAEHDLDLRDADTLLYFSVHGTPIKYLDEGNRYDRYIEEQCRDIAGRLGVDSYGVGFQNHTNRRIAWTQPDNEDRIREADERRLVVVPISFMHEQSETLAELDHELRDFVEGLGKELHRVPVPHDADAFTELLADLVAALVTGPESESMNGRALARCRCAPLDGVWCTNGNRELPPSPYARERQGAS